MKITRHNYESFLIDYLDGCLDANLQAEMRIFLEQNPDIKNEFENLDQTFLTAEPIRMPGKQQLKKESAEIPAFDHRCIAYMEGDMTEDEKIKLEKETAQSDEKARILKMYTLTRLIPSLAIGYPDKKTLKKATGSFRRVMLYTSMSAAAGILLIAGFFFLNSGGKQGGNASQIALMDVSVTELSTQYPRTMTSESPANQIEKVNEKMIQKKNRKEVIHQPDFFATQLPDNIINDEQEEKKVKKNDQPEKNDTTRNFIIPNEILLKQNEKQLADNQVKHRPAEKKSGFMYYLEQGVKGVRSLTGKDVDLSRQTDENGKTQQFAFNIGKFKVSHSKSE